MLSNTSKKISDHLQKVDFVKFIIVNFIKQNINIMKKLNDS